jgi:tRNA A-37 threonylcarbamoyl transferase component Bud32
MIDYTGQTIEGKYHIMQLLGEGGMGRVYLGEHVIIGRPVAVKFLHAELTTNEEIVRRFYREAQSAAAIRHKNVIDVLDVGMSPEGEPFLVMEYLQGEALSDMLARVSTVDLPTACGILEPALIALQAAHDQGIVHRDLKPENIFLAHQPGEAPQVKLIDFGISKINEAMGQTKLTRDGSLLGTPEYMSPEQARGAADLDHRSDLYAMGVILYEMLVGERPFVGESYSELLMAVLTSEPRPPHDVNPEFPDEAAEVIGPALAREPEDRFQSATEMLAALRAMPGFESRQQQLTMLAPGLSSTGVAAGDLGQSIVRGRTNVAEEVLDQVIRERAPGPIAKIEARAVKLVDGNVYLSKVVDKLGGGRRGMRRALAAVGGILLLGILFSTLCMAGGDDEDTVMITVINAPPKAKIYLDGYLVEENPFRVNRGEALVPLAVEVHGRKKLKISITPNEDQVVDVAGEEVITESDVAEQEAADEVAAEAAEKAEQEAAAKAAEKAEAKEKKTEPKPSADKPKKTKAEAPEKKDEAQPKKKGKKESKVKKFFKKLGKKK